MVVHALDNGLFYLVFSLAEFLVEMPIFIRCGPNDFPRTRRLQGLPLFITGQAALLGGPLTHSRDKTQIASTIQLDNDAITWSKGKLVVPGEAFSAVTLELNLD